MRGEHLLKPGEISLAHYGVLYLDELPKCKRNVLEVWRQPLSRHGKKAFDRWHNDVVATRWVALL